MTFILPDAAGSTMMPIFWFSEAASLGRGLAREIVRVWLETPFAGGRHQRRLEKIAALEKKILKNNLRCSLQHPKPPVTTLVLELIDV